MNLPDNLQPPEGCVILGWGGTFEVPEVGIFAGHSFWPGQYPDRHSVDDLFGLDKDLIYAAPIDSEIARLNSPEKTDGSGTPRTLDLLNRELAGEPIKIGDWTDFARTLERELAAKDALIGELERRNEELNSYVSDYSRQAARARTRETALNAEIERWREHCQTLEFSHEEAMENARKALSRAGKEADHG